MRFIQYTQSSLISLILFTASLAYTEASNADLSPSQATNTLCNQEIALCTSAPCIPEPNDPSKAICFCDIQNGKSMATLPCKSLISSTDAQGIRTVYSTYSPSQFKEGKKTMKCPNGTPWASCFNKQCTVDPSNSKKAICICDIRHSGEWVTLGGNCKPTTCTAGYWSGALLNDYESGNQFMMKALKMKKSPEKLCNQLLK